MASRVPQIDGPPRNIEGKVVRASPGQLQTTNINRNPRYSFMETPVEMQEPIFQQFSSPTNSTIDESPISPDGARNFTRGITTSFPVRNDMALRAGNAHNLPSAQAVHPAHFAPYAEDSSDWQSEVPLSPAIPQSPGPIPMKTREGLRSPTMTPVCNGTYDQRKTNTAGIAPDAERGALVYNPDSLAGPNAGHGTHQPGQISHPNAAVEPEWKHSLCELDTLCCIGVFCPCIVYGKTQYRLSRKTQKQDPTDLLRYESCNGACGLLAMACGFQWVLASIQRTRTRKQYHLNGGFGSDCLKSFCCCCCVLMQNEREIRDREESIRRHAGPASGPYIAPGTMSYAPPPR